MLDRLVIGAPQWVLPTMLAVICLIILVVYTYVRARTMPSIRAWAAFAKIVAITSIAWCLLEPLWSGKRPRPQANMVALLVDNSQSMTISDDGDSTARKSELQTTLADNSPWRKRLAEDFDVRSYAFDSRLRAMNEIDKLDFAGVSSAMLAALETVSERFAGRPMAGILLFTDGNATDVSLSSIDWKSLGMRVFPVIRSSTQVTRDVRIEDVVTTQSDFETTPITLDARIAATTMSGVPLTIQLYDQQNTLVEQQTLDAPPDDRTKTVRFRFRPKQVGPQFYRLFVAPTDQLENSLRGESSVESTVVNNASWVAVQRRRGPYRILYVSGRPNWEFKFLRRAIQEDTEMELVGLLRIAKEAPKFVYKDRAVSSANPLFEGLGDKEEESAEQRDQPVLLRVGVKGADELQAGFPVSADELFQFDAVILDDIEAKFFTQDQMLMLRRFVNDRGGGLLLLGGPDAVARGGFETSPIAEMAPVYAERDKQARQAPAARFQLSREGMLLPWMRLRATENAEQNRVDQMPTFMTWNPVTQAKPGATVLATMVVGEPANLSSTDSRPTSYPAFIVQRFGKGRCACLAIGDLWRWEMHRKPDDEHDLGQAWRQWLRWLTSDVPRRVQLDVGSISTPDEPVKIEVLAQDEEFKALDNADVQLILTQPDGSEVTLATNSSVHRAGVYTAEYWPHAPGGYRLRAEVKAPDGSDVGQAEAGWISDPAAAEYRRLDTNQSQLQLLAQSTGGEVVGEDELDEFVKSLPQRSMPVTEHWVYPLWHHPWVLGLAVLGLCVEWGLRRWKGLP